MNGSNKAIWISGTRGFIGLYLVRSLLSAGYQIKCVSNSNTDNSSIIHIDFSDRNKIAAAIENYGIPHTFIHLGWGSVYEPQSDVHLTTNVTAGKNLIKELYSYGLEKFIFMGSSSEYGDREGSLAENISPTGKLNKYVKGKLEVSSYGREIAEQLDRIFVHIRLFYTYGAGQHANSLINQLYKSYMKNRKINLSPCEHYRDYIYISDVVQGIILISHISESGIVNLGSGKVIQLKDFISLFWQCLGGEPASLNFGSHPKPQHEPSQPYCYSNLDTLKRLTKWTPAISLAECIQKTVNTLRVCQ